MTRTMLGPIIRLAGLALVTGFFVGCSNVKFYSDAELTKETGLRHYPPKPYVMVAHKAKDQTEIQIVYLPDKEHPQYMKYRPRLGSHEFSVGLANGIMTSYGQKSDTKVPELIQAMTGLLTQGVATAEKAGVFATQAAKDLKNYRPELEGIASNLVDSISGIQISDAEKSKDKVDMIAGKLKKAAQLIGAPIVNDLKPVRSLLQESKDELGVLSIKLPDRFDPGTPQARYNQALLTASARIGAVLDAITEQPTPVSFEFYEIVQDGGKTKLVKCQP